MEALKVVLMWLLALCVAAAAVAVPCILAAPYFQEAFTYRLAVVVAAAVALLLVVAFHQALFSTSVLSSKASSATRCAPG